MEEKYFQLLILIMELCRVGQGDQKLDLFCILIHLLVVLISLFCQLNFLFLSMETCIFCVVVVLMFFVEYYLLSNVNKELV